MNMGDRVIGARRVTLGERERPEQARMKRAHCSACVDRFPATGNRRAPTGAVGATVVTGVEGAALLVEVDGGARGMFSRIAVINRGEPAVRLIRAVRELNAEFGYDIKVIALHTQAE